MLGKVEEQVYVYLIILLEFVSLVSGNLEIIVSGDIQNVEPFYIKERE